MLGILVAEFLPVVKGLNHEIHELHEKKSKYNVLINCFRIMSNLRQTCAKKRLNHE